MWTNVYSPCAVRVSSIVSTFLTVVVKERSSRIIVRWDGMCCEVCEDVDLSWLLLFKALVYRICVPTMNPHKANKVLSESGSIVNVCMVNISDYSRIHAGPGFNAKNARTF